MDARIDRAPHREGGVGQRPRRRRQHQRQRVDARERSAVATRSAIVPRKLVSGDAAQKQSTALRIPAGYIGAVRS